MGAAGYREHTGGKMDDGREEAENGHKIPFTIPQNSDFVISVLAFYILICQLINPGEADSDRACACVYGINFKIVISISN